MRILVVGAGAVGGSFGARLAEAGRDVTFLVRPRRAEELRRHGLQIISPLGDRTVRASFATAGDLTSPYDVVIVALKGFELAGALDDVAPAIGPFTMLVPLLDGMRHLDLLSERFGASTVLGGVCYVAAVLDDDGLIVQLDGLQELIYGERDGSLSARVSQLDALLRGAGFEARLSQDIMQEMWEKWVILAAVGAITSLLRGNIGEIEAVPGGAGLALRMFAECVAIAAASGASLREEFVPVARAVITRRGSTSATSMYRDLQRGRHVDVEHILGDLVARSRQLSVDAPLLKAALAQLRIYEHALSARTSAETARVHPNGLARGMLSGFPR
jgi:2-dehydropantoate 2-reductase